MGWMGPPSARRWVSGTWAQTCLRYFLGLVKGTGGEEGVGSRPQFSLEREWAGARASPLSGGPALWR